MICPFMSYQFMQAFQECQKENCILWCNSDGCAIKKIALELTKLTERKE